MYGEHNHQNGGTEDTRGLYKIVTKKLSPALFNFYTDDIISVLVHLMQEKYFNLNISLRMLAFADDLMLFVDSQHYMQQCGFTFSLLAEQYWFQISTGKTKVIRLNGSDHLRNKVLLIIR